MATPSAWNQLMCSVALTTMVARPRTMITTGLVMRRSGSSGRARYPLEHRHKIIRADGAQDAREVVSILVHEARRGILALHRSTRSAAGPATCASWDRRSAGSSAMTVISG
jgi:hypothetical protein